ncbi:hypothetical protein TNCV_4059611 [Trichonephila clavipes]|nr:hypothetical protein TNCV_4059611 [Trichonephila clavipes]
MPAWEAVGSLVVRALDSRPKGLGLMPDTTKYPQSTHGRGEAHAFAVKRDNIRIERSEIRASDASNEIRTVQLEEKTLENAFFEIEEGPMYEAHGHHRLKKWAGPQHAPRPFSLAGHKSLPSPIRAQHAYTLERSGPRVP